MVWMTVSSNIFLDEVRIHAYHGVMPQENEVGQDFLVSARCGVDMTSAMQSDLLESTLDYSLLYHLIEEEMYKTSQLLEHVIKLVSSLQLQSESINTWKVGVERALKKYIDGSDDGEQ